MEKINGNKDGIIVLKKEGEQEMPTIICPKCYEDRSHPIIVQCDGDARLRGIIQCLTCGHELPITLYKNFIQELDIALPGTQSDNLNPSVPDDIKDDVRESERANYAQCDKACVTMCRRALQLGLIDRGMADGRLSVMLKDALGQKLLKQKTYDLATTIKGYGDIGAHRREKLDPTEVKMVIYATVGMLNELFP